METIYFGAGCFWCSEAAFTRLKGVSGVRSGYAGGEIANPTYEQVSSGQTGHAEVVKVDYDSSVISLRDLLAVFFTIHDPTTLNRQGYDVGTQYRSVIFYTSDQQKEIIELYLAELTRDQIFQSPIVTEVREFSTFFEADSSHYRYYEMNGNAPYCKLVIDPKITKLKKTYAHLLK